MNFSNTRNLSRLLSLLVAVLMLATLFAGCKKDDSTDDTSSEPNINLNLSDNTTPPETQTQPTETEPVVINEKQATVTQQLNIRSAPSSEGSTIIGTLYAGDKVEVERRETVTGIEWAYITSPESGWVTMDYITMDYVSNDPAGNDTSTPAGENPPAETKPNDTANTQNIKGVVTASELRIRSEASTNAGVAGAYKKGDTITILETKNGWGRTDKGWVKLDYVNTNGTTVNNTTNNTNNNNTTANGNGSTAVQFKGIVTAKELNIRSTASIDGDRVGSLNFGARVEILEKSGDWGRTKDGWISLNYVYQDGTTGTNTAKGIVIGDNLNVRSGPGIGYDPVGSLSYGDRVNILEQFTYNDTTWGCTKDGWISLYYVYIDGTDVGESGPGTVIGENLNIRSGPGIGYDPVGSLNSGDKVTILFQLEVGNTTWGCTKDGWISLDYVDLD